MIRFIKTPNQNLLYREIRLEGARMEYENGVRDEALKNRKAHSAQMITYSNSLSTVETQKGK